jgi:GNAT superfamily N-acetyltransferase
MTDFFIRRARPGDEGEILALLGELADYEKLRDKFLVTAETIRRDWLGVQSLLHCDLAFAGGAPVGVATWYWTYASFAAARGLYLEDLFVRPAMRGKGYGKALLAHLAKTAADAGAVRVEWEVLPWNTPSIKFYESLGARRHDEWLVYSLGGDALKTLGGA